MLIAITGKPHSGKTTLLKNLIRTRINHASINDCSDQVESLDLRKDDRNNKGLSQSGNLWGFLTEEIPDLTQPSKRSGFNLRASNGSHCTLASIELAGKMPQVSRYGVDLNALNSFLEQLRDPQSNEIAYIDEVGEMELLSDNFAEFVLRWERLSEHLIISLSEVYFHPLIDQIKERADLLIEVTKESREQSAIQLSQALNSLKI